MNVFDAFQIPYSAVSAIMRNSSPRQRQARARER
jgi:hypothetical protein